MRLPDSHREHLNQFYPHYAWWKGMRHANLVDDDKLMTRKYESYKQKH